MRVTGLGKLARLLGVVCQPAPLPGGAPASQFTPSEKIRLLVAKKDTLEADLRLREHEIDFLVGYGRTLGAQHVSPGVVSEFVKNLVVLGEKNRKAVEYLKECIVQAQREIEEEAEKIKAKKGTTKAEVTLLLNSQQQHDLDLKLIYRAYCFCTSFHFRLHPHPPTSCRERILGADL